MRAKNNQPYEKVGSDNSIPLFFKKKIHPTASHEPTLPNSISSSPYFPNKLLLLGKRCALAVFQYIFLSPIIIGLNIPSQLPLNKVRVHTLQYVSCIRTRLFRLFGDYITISSRASPALSLFPNRLFILGRNMLQQFLNTSSFPQKLLGCPNISPQLPSNKIRVLIFPIYCCIEMRLLGNCKSMSPNYL